MSGMGARQETAENSGQTNGPPLLQDSRPARNPGNVVPVTLRGVALQLGETEEAQSWQIGHANGLVRQRDQPGFGQPPQRLVHALA